MKQTKQLIDKEELSKDMSKDADFHLHLWALLFHTHDIIAKARDLELNQYKLSGVQFTVLFILNNENKPLTIAQIASLNMREPSAVLSLIKRMEKLGLVKKFVDQGEDKFKVTLTDKGRKLYNEASRLSLDMIFTSLSTEEKQQLNLCLRKLRVKGRELLGIDYKPPFLRGAPL